MSIKTFIFTWAYIWEGWAFGNFLPIGWLILFMAGCFAIGTAVRRGLKW